MNNYKPIIVVLLVILLSSCAQYMRPELTPLDQAKLNINAYRVQLESLSNQIDQYNSIATSRESLQLLQEIDKYLLKAISGLSIYIKNVKEWESMEEPPAGFYINGYNLRSSLKRIVLLMDDLAQLKTKGEL